MLMVLIFCGFSSVNGVHAEIVDRIVATVNEDVITLSELDQEFMPYAARIRSLGYSPEKERKMLFKVRTEILNKLIDQKLTDQEIKRNGITVSEAEVDRAIERLKESAFLSDEDLRTKLRAEGMTLDDYRDRMREQILRSKLLNYEIKSKIVITEEDIKACYAANPEKYCGEKKYRLRHILMRVPSYADDEKKMEIRKRMDDVMVKLNAGEPFEKMEQEYSESSISQNGGGLGVFSLDALSPQLRDALKDLKGGEYTPVLDTDHGYQILLVEEIVLTPGKSLEEASAEIEEQLFTEIVNKNFENWLADLRQRSHIKIIQ